MSGQTKRGGWDWKWLTEKKMREARASNWKKFERFSGEYVLIFRIMARRATTRALLWLPALLAIAVWVDASGGPIAIATAVSLRSSGGMARNGTARVIRRAELTRAELKDVKTDSGAAPQERHVPQLPRLLSAYEATNPRPITPDRNLPGSRAPPQA